MGAFLVAVITMIRVIFEYIVYQYEKTEMKDNIVFKCVTCYIRCILKCLDACIKFMNKNAYIQVALHNDNFCTAAKDSFFLMASNGSRFTAVGRTGAILFPGWIAGWKSEAEALSGIWENNGKNTVHKVVISLP
jgi:hypothetical protein